MVRGPLGLRGAMADEEAAPNDLHDALRGIELAIVRNGEIGWGTATGIVWESGDWAGQMTNLVFRI